MPIFLEHKILIRLLSVLNLSAVLAESLPARLAEQEFRMSFGGSLVKVLWEKLDETLALLLESFTLKHVVFLVF